MDRGLVSDKEFQKVTIFAKREPKNIPVLLSNTVKAMEVVDDRCINACSDALKVAIGPTMCALAWRLARTWHSNSPVFFEYDADDVEIGEWYQYGLEHYAAEDCMELDCSRIDATHTPWSLSLGFDVMQSYGVSRHVMRLLRLQLENVHGSSRNGVAYDRIAFNRSGVPNTTLTNTIAVACAFVAGVLAAGGRLEELRLMVKGDDSFAFLPRKYHKSVEETFRKMGFIPKVKSGHPQYDHTFCSNLFYPVEVDGRATFRPGPTPKALRKFFVTISDVPVRRALSHVRGVCLGLRHIANHVPMLHELIENCLDALPRVFDSTVKEALARSRTKLLSSQAKSADYTSKTWDMLAMNLRCPGMGQALRLAAEDYAQRCATILAGGGAAGILWTAELEWLARVVQASCE